MVDTLAKTSFYQHLVDIEELSLRLSTPLTSPIESLNKQMSSMNLDVYTEALKSYTSLADLYRIPDYLDTSVFIRHDFEDRGVSVDVPSVSSTALDENTLTVAENTRANDINKANLEYLEYLRSRSGEIATSIMRTEFEDGMDNDVTLLIKSFAKRNKSATYNWLDELYSTHLNHSSVLQGILRTLAMITERGDENILMPMVVASLRSNSSAEQESAIMVIEEWRTKECLEALCSVQSYASEMIADYAKMVTKELKEELGQC
jgi:hypothetical protein